MKILLTLCLAANILSFLLMGLDKHYAKTHHRRIPEKTLFLSACALGGLGANAGMFFFRHKTKHTYFRIGFPLILLCQIALLCFLSDKLPR